MTCKVDDVLSTREAFYRQNFQYVVINNNIPFFQEPPIELHKSWTVNGILKLKEVHVRGYIINFWRGFM